MRLYYSRHLISFTFPSSGAAHSRRSSRSFPISQTVKMSLGKNNVNRGIKEGDEFDNSFRIRNLARLSLALSGSYLGIRWICSTAVELKKTGVIWDFCGSFWAFRSDLIFSIRRPVIYGNRDGERRERLENIIRNFRYTEWSNERYIHSSFVGN